VKPESRAHKLLRWYPQEWRQRYGDELVAMIDDTIGDCRPTFRFRANIARAGLRERGHSAGLLGAQSNLHHQVRAGALLVLCSWSTFVVAGATFQKQSEHFGGSVASTSTATLAASAYDVVALMGIVGSLAVLVGAAVALPSFISFLKSGGWHDLRRQLAVAGLLTLSTIGGVIALKDWAHGLSVGQRNGGDAYYSFLFVVVALILTASVIQWTVVGVVAIRRMTLSTRVLRIEALLAFAVTFAMVVITTGVALWWIAMGLGAPGFFQGNTIGNASLALTPNLLLMVVLMLISSLGGLFGSARILHGWQRI
jgi:hypothetical protein